MCLLLRRESRWRRVITPGVAVEDAGGQGKEPSFVLRCRLCLNPHDSDCRPRHLSAESTECLLLSASDKCPPFHAKEMDVEPRVDIEPFGWNFIVVHHFIRGIGGGYFAVLYRARWVDSTSTSWKQESDLCHHHCAILLYWTRAPGQGGSGGGLRCVTMRRYASAIELHRERGEGFVAKGRFLVPP